MEEAGEEEAEAEDGADDDLKTRTPHNDVGKKAQSENATPTKSRSRREPLHNWQETAEAPERQKTTAARQTPTQPPKGPREEDQHPRRAEAPEFQQTTTNHNHRKTEKHPSMQMALGTKDKCQQE